MPMNTNINTDDLTLVTGSQQEVIPSLGLKPPVAPFFVSSIPSLSIVNPDSVNTFTLNGIPQYRIFAPTPLWLSNN